MGRNPKVDFWLEKDSLLKIEAWARDGLVEQQISHNMGINLRTLTRWKKEHPAIKQALKKGKEVVDIEVENALLKRALGYDYEEITTEITDGRKHVKKITRHVPGDVGALCFWLKNRKPTSWRDKPQAFDQGDSEEFDKLLKVIEDAKNATE